MKVRKLRLLVFRKSSLKTSLLIFLLILLASLLLFGGLKWLNKPVQIDESNQGQTVNVGPGGTLELSLPSNPSTGYTWLYVYPIDNDILTEVDHYFQSTSKALGASGKECWIFEAVGDGSSTISLKYCRPWEKAPPEKTFEVKIIVGCI